MYNSYNRYYRYYSQSRYYRYIRLNRHLYLLDDVNVIDAQRWFPHEEPPMNFEVLLLLVLLVIFSCELIHVFLS